MPLTKIILTLLIPVAGCWSFVSVLMLLIFHPIRSRSVAGIKMQGILPLKRDKITEGLASRIADSIREMSGRIFTGTTVLAALRPDIEKQVDEFLKDRLKEAFPLMHQMMGEKTLAKFKIVFLEEVENILPVLLEKQSSGLLSKVDLKKKIVTEINKISLAEVENEMFLPAVKESHIKLLAFVAGLIIGLLQLLIEFSYHS